MYESHFGITRSPFQLTPDPWFYFDSSAHRPALAALRRGCGPAQSFVVVSGEIGSGKSMLVRRRLDEFDARVVVGYIASTQLTGDELRSAVGAAFGIPLAEQPNASWEREFAGLMASLQAHGKRAVLVIDEAQHIDRDGLAVLEALAPSSPQGPPLLEVWLIGQPELRQRLAVPELAAFRSRLGSSSHLGPLEPAETRAYIEHRLGKVGWAGRPQFDAGAFEAIHRGTGGLPRQINRLCNRLLLACFLAGALRIDTADVARAAHDLQMEIDGRSEATDPVRDATAPPPAVQQPASAPRAPVPPPAPSASLPASPAAPVATGRLLFVVGGHADHIKAAALMHALSTCAHPLPCALVRVYRNDALRLHRALFAGSVGEGDCVELDVTANAQALQATQLSDRFERLLKAHAPCAVVVFDGSELALACSVVASKHGVPVASVGAGVRQLERTRTSDLTRALTDRLASLLYAPDEAAAQNLRLDGIEAQRIQCVGNIVADALAAGLRKGALATAAWQSRIPDEVLSNRRGYGVVVLNQPAHVERRERLADLVQVLRQARRDLPLVWTMERRTEQRLKDFGLSPVIASERIVCLPMQAYPDFVQLLDQATCVLSDSTTVDDEALALGVPCLSFFDPADRGSGPGPAAAVAIGCDPRLVTRALWNILYGGGGRTDLPAQWDGQAGARIAGHLSTWLRGQRASCRPAQDEKLVGAES